MMSIIKEIYWTNRNSTSEVNPLGTVGLKVDLNWLFLIIGRMNKPLRKQNKTLSVIFLRLKWSVKIIFTLLIASILDVFPLFEAFNEDVL